MNKKNFRALRVEVGETFDVTKAHEEQVSERGVKGRVTPKKRHRGKQTASGQDGP